MEYTQEFKDESFSQFLDATLLVLEFSFKSGKPSNEKIISLKEGLIKMSKNVGIDTNEKMGAINQAFNNLMIEHGYDKVF
ncbi:MAG: hypothetical protein BWY74_03896 [Firmicutes bacterium ADurb.Bin419]|nr:MAG: hypothetical protein BWY74_03896 [Firmicutes bacterium ADurb.Bin419]